jgi:hypothetical protein
MKRRLAATFMALSLIVAFAGSADAMVYGALPSSQSHAHGVASSWSLTWAGTAPYTIFWAYDVNVPTWYWTIANTYTTSKNLSATYYPCVTTKFTERMDATDHIPGSGGSTKVFSTEGGGTPC